MGGALALAAAAASDIFSSCVPYYGAPRADMGVNIGNIKCPCLGHFGETDHAVGFSDPETARKLEVDAKALGVDFTLRMWPAGHAFMNQANPETYNAEVAKQSLQETVAFFNKHF